MALCVNTALVCEWKVGATESTKWVLCANED